MKDKTVIVTGASRGLGAAAARACASLGANVVLMARSKDDLGAVQSAIRTLGGQALSIPGDISQPQDCEAVIVESTRVFGSLDAIINNAGVIEPIAPVAEGDAQSWETNLRINVLGPLFMVQAALPHLRPRRGRVINVSSGAAVNVVRGWGAYCTAKAALNHFNRVLADEEPAITVIAFRPGMVDTAMQTTIRQTGVQGMPTEEYNRFIEAYASGDLLPPEVPGTALAVLALYASHAWSGEFIAWDDPRLLSLVQQHNIS